MPTGRRSFLRQAAVGGVAISSGAVWAQQDARQAAAVIGDPADDLDIFGYMKRLGRPRNPALFRQILGAANDFKEGDEGLGIAAADERSRRNARLLLSRTSLAQIDSIPLIQDQLSRVLRDSEAATPDDVELPRTVGELKSFLLNATEEQIKRLSPSLSSAVIGCVVKLMSNVELTSVGSKIFHSLPGSRIGAKGYLGARLQPNSPTDHVDDIRWQVFNGWSFAVGDVVLGTNPVSSDPESVAAIELALQDLLRTFGLEEVLPQCVLSHIDVQAQVEKDRPGSTALWFQSIAGTDDANETFDISIEKMLNYASQRTGRYGLYFETGQGADYTNGHGHGFDMVLHESRKYGFARAMKQRIAVARGVPANETWVHLNDVAGFIGPEVFRSREQLVRCCLEDIVMGKLHGLTIGLDVCSTLHMDVSLADLDWCLDEIMPANPAYLMALPTKIDPMLGYLTTGFQDHVRIREKFGFRVSDRVWKFFQDLEVIDGDGRPTKHFGDPAWVYRQYRRRQGDQRPDTDLEAEARQQIDAVQKRGVFIAEGWSEQPWELAPSMKKSIDRIYADAKDSIWAQWDPEFVEQIPSALTVRTRSRDRTDYILHPTSGENLAPASVRKIGELRKLHAGRYDTQIVISEGLNAHSLMDEGQLAPFLVALRTGLEASGCKTAPKNIVVTSGRVRAGYQIGELLFRSLPQQRAIVHVIGERPGTGHHTFSVYITAPDGAVWSESGRVDHNITRVVSGIATTSLLPVEGAAETIRILNGMAPRA